MNCNFTFDHFKECIEHAKSLGFSFYSMFEYLEEKPNDKFIVMRHDVDLSMKHALSLAELENSLGICSTYFIRVDGIFDPFSGMNFENLKKIKALGHEIGLHYEYDKYSVFEFKEYVRQNVKQFESVGIKVYGAALHKAKKLGREDTKKLNLVEEFLDEVGLEYDAYSNVFMKDMKFISDSKFRWREGCMCNHFENFSKLCILTHPIWWSENTTSLVSLIEEVVKENKE